MREGGRSRSPTRKESDLKRRRRIFLGRKRQSTREALGKIRATRVVRHERAALERRRRQADSPSVEQATGSMEKGRMGRR